jgi:hypothetical protein
MPLLTELGDLFRTINYKYAAPTALVPQPSGCKFVKSERTTRARLAHRTSKDEVKMVDGM